MRYFMRKKAEKKTIAKTTKTVRKAKTVKAPVKKIKTKTVERLIVPTHKLEKTINVKVNVNSYEMMKKLADKFCGGNLSTWIRFSSINFIPKKKDLVKVKIES